MVVLKRVVPAAMVCVALAGCGSVGAISVPWGKRSQPEPMAAAIPTPPVQQSNLPPPPPPVDGPVVAEALPNGADASMPLPDGTTAAAAPAGGTGAGGSFTRTDLLGGWTITASGDSCQLFMTLTSWTGGYRASTRGCTTDTLKSISAWNLEGKQVVLGGTGGTPVAKLYASGGNRFDGQTETGGTPVTFYR